MEGVGEPTPQGHLEGVTIVADLSVDLGPGAWWISAPATTHTYPAVVKLERLYSSPSTWITVPKLVEEVPPTDLFTGTRLHQVGRHYRD